MNKKIKKIENNGCFGDSISIIYDDGSSLTLAFFNKEHRNRAIKVFGELISQLKTQQNTEIIGDFTEN
jgi:hypothetical protein